MDYTKGPWKWVKLGDNVSLEGENKVIIYSGENHNLIATQADKNLIAAAPDMYEACLSALGLLAVDNPGELPTMMERVKESLINALNKAEGREG